MKHIIFVFFIFAISLFTACNDIYRNFQSVKDMKWYDTDVKTFDVTIPEDGNYDLIFAMRHSTGYPFTTIKIHIKETIPENKIYEKDAEFPVADENGKYIGEVTGQLWDIEAAFDKNVSLKKGKYTFRIQHNMNHNPVILVIDIGLIVRKHVKE